MNGDPYGVPTGYVPACPRAELERQLLLPDPPMAPMKGLQHFHQIEQEVNAPTDAQIAAALRALLAQYGAHGYVDVAVLRAIAQSA